MKRLLLPLLAALALPTNVSAESAWLIIRDGKALESVPMKDMEQCELMGAKLIASKRWLFRVGYGFECLEGR